jgi:transposase InsO family protein
MGIRRLYGALGQFGSIPFIERLIRTIKWECTRRILFPYSAQLARKELGLFTVWYNRVRPHERLRGATPDEVHDGAEVPLPRVVGPNTAALTLQVHYLEGRKHLPIVELVRAA